MKNYAAEIRIKTTGMCRKEKLSYILTYYWYHILGLIAAVGLPVFVAAHVTSGMERPEFTCVLVNQAIDSARDAEIGWDIAGALGVETGRIVVDSDYNISYGDVKLTGANESSYEKFFFKWRNKELDAVILPESFYRYCQELGGAWLDLGRFDTGALPLYEDQGVYTAVAVEETGLGDYLSNETGERLLLAFPESGSHTGACQTFLDLIGGL